MNNQPLVSVIIPTYNRAHLIGQTLDSVLAQTYQNWECIIVDDGSSDHTDEVVGAYVEKDSRFKYYHRPEEHLPGGNGARNYGFKMSQGDYVNWFDSDDLLIKEALDIKISPFKKKSDINYTICGFQVFNKKKIFEAKNVNNFENILSAYLSNLVILNLPTITYKRNSIDKIAFNEKLTRAQDLDFAFRFFSSKNRVGFHIKQSLILVRQHTNQITSSFDKLIYKDVSSEIYVRRNIFLYSRKFLNAKTTKLSLFYFMKSLVHAIDGKHYKLFFGNFIAIYNYSVSLASEFYFWSTLYIFLKKGRLKFKRCYQRLLEK
jgi:glycosyltransferase involved in cell wall biosynthesis